MQNDSEQQFAERLHQELRRLPPLAAPKTLMPRVLSAIEARARQPWWKKSYAAWPGTIQWTFLAVLLALVGTGCFYAFHLGSGFSMASVSATVAGWFSYLSPLWKITAALGNALLTVARSGGQILVWGTVAVMTAMYLTCVGLGTVCYRVALNKI